jgi:hypothetical protein
MGWFAINISRWNNKEYGRKEFMKVSRKIRKQIENVTFQVEL